MSIKRFKTARSVAMTVLVVGWADAVMLDHAVESESQHMVHRSGGWITAEIGHQTDTILRQGGMSDMFQR